MAKERCNDSSLVKGGCGKIGIFANISPHLSTKYTFELMDVAGISSWGCLPRGSVVSVCSVDKLLFFLSTDTTDGHGMKSCFDGCGGDFLLGLLAKGISGFRVFSGQFAVCSLTDNSVGIRMKFCVDE
ncbi:MAG: hypothetical protein JJU11_18170 [Candidatus Sumerlaeia bacterium]|nr:hypothetical protein [Candidatus Sumerlaeia bacterium]